MVSGLWFFSLFSLYFEPLIFHSFHFSFFHNREQNDFSSFFANIIYKNGINYLNDKNSTFLNRRTTITNLFFLTLPNFAKWILFWPKIDGQLRRLTTFIFTIAGHMSRLLRTRDRLNLFNGTVCSAGKSVFIRIWVWWFRQSCSVPSKYLISWTQLYPSLLAQPSPFQNSRVGRTTRTNDLPV